MTAPRSAPPALALLLLLPAAVCLWPGPGAPLLDVPTPVSTGAGLAALAALPAALALAILRPTRRGSAPELLALLGLVAAVGLGQVRDTFAADRALLAWTTAAVLLLGGTCLDAAGRRLFARGAVLLSLLALAAAHVGPAWTGVLGNTGDLSEVALPGAVIGAGLFVTTRGPLRLAGLAAAGLHAVYSGLVPVWAGVLGWIVAAAGLNLLRGRGPQIARHGRIALLACLAALLPIAGRALLGGGAGEAEAQPTPVVAADLEGAPVRLAIWRTLPGMVAAAPLVGHGPGQFQAAYPPHRDPTEIEASSKNRAETTPIEVEHPHDDPLLVFAEHGVLGGLLFLALLVLVAQRALRQLAGGKRSGALLAPAALAVLANSLVNSNLVAGVASPWVAWPLFGALLASAPAGRWPQARFAPVAFGLLLALQAPRALDFVQHGQALRDVKGARTVREGREVLDAKAVERVLARALAARPDSIEALQKRDELLSAQGADVAARRGLLERTLVRRPHHLRTWLTLGAVEAGSGRLGAAQRAFDAARELDPRNPKLARNRLRLALDRRDVEAVRAALIDVRAATAMDDHALELLAADQALLGRLGVAEALLAELWSEELNFDDLDAVYRRSIELRDEPRERLADAWLVAYQVGIAREHRATGLLEQGVRMARQALQTSHRWPDVRGSRGALHLELAAALARAGDVEAARGQLSESPPMPVDLLHLVPDDGQALMESGVLPR